MSRIFYISLPGRPRCCLPAQDTLHLPSAQNHVSLEPQKIYQARKTFCTALHLGPLSRSPPLALIPFPLLLFLSSFIPLFSISSFLLSTLPPFRSLLFPLPPPPPPPQSLTAPRPPYSEHQSFMMHCGRCCICNFIPFARNNTCGFLVRPSACSLLRRREELLNVNCLL